MRNGRERMPKKAITDGAQNAQNELPPAEGPPPIFRRSTRNTPKLKAGAVRLPGKTRASNQLWLRNWIGQCWRC